jgi:MFS family permease
VPSAAGTTRSRWILSGRLATKFAPLTVVGVTGALAAISLAALAVSHDWAVYLSALAVCGFTMGLWCTRSPLWRRRRSYRPTVQARRQG